MANLLTFFAFRNFSDVAKLVAERAHDLPKYQIQQFWHHCFLEAFHFLSFKRL